MPSEQKKPPTSNARVFISNADYDQIDPVIESLIDSLNLSNWREDLSGKTVFIKPNLIGLFQPDRHATSHPSIIKALVLFFQKIGANVIVGDNCGIGGYGLNQKVAKTTHIIESSNGTYRNVAFNTEIISINSRFIETIGVSKDMLEADILVNVPKMKTHSLTLVTGAVKNMFGIVAGAGKSRCHKSAPKLQDFSELLTDIYAIRPPDLNIMDGIMGMEGDGPTSGKPIRVGKILASTNAVALDSVMCGIMGVSPNKVHHLKIASERKLGPIETRSIQIIGETPRHVNFKLPVAVQRFNFLSRLINNLFFGSIVKSKMALDEKLCKKCKLCVEGCPTKAMEMDNVPQINETKCIKCMCCHELCPESAWKARGVLGRLYGKQI